MILKKTDENLKESLNMFFFLILLHYPKEELIRNNPVKKVRGNYNELKNIFRKSRCAYQYDE